MATASHPSHDEPDLDRSARRRAAILDAASRLFLEKGYAGTSMDEIAAVAGASKQTVYKHFDDKERLFSAIVMATVNDAGDEVDEDIRRLADTADLEADLRALARRQLELVMQPRILQLRRLIIAEAGRFPELGRSFYERGQERTVAALAAAFERLAERGMLQLDDPDQAAAQFNWLIMARPINRAMLLGEDHPPTPDELERNVVGAVRTFLAAFGR
jgi:AcrR family transcriptional regulator